MLNTKKINNIDIKKISLKDMDERETKYKNLFESKYFCSYIYGKRGSGKTNLLCNILPYLVHKKETDLVMIICNSYNTDPLWKWIIEYLNKNKINNICYPTMTEIEMIETPAGRMKNEKVNHIQDLLDILKDKQKEKENEKNNDNDNYLSIAKTKRKPKKEPFIYSKYLLLCDDISNELHNPSLQHLIKIARHWKLNIILLSQVLNDIPSGVKGNLNNIILYKNCSLPSLQNLYKYSNINIPFNEFYNIYRQTTKEEENKRNFLYIDLDKSELRKNFNELINYK